MEFHCVSGNFPALQPKWIIGYISAVREVVLIDSFRICIYFLNGVSVDFITAECPCQKVSWTDELRNLLVRNGCGPYIKRTGRIPIMLRRSFHFKSLNRLAAQ